MDSKITNASSRGENPLRNYKVPINDQYSKPPLNSQNFTPKKKDKHEINTSMEKLSTTQKTCKGSDSDKRGTTVLISEIHHHRNSYQQKENSFEATTSKQKFHDEPKVDLVIPEMNPTVTYKRSSGSDNNIIRYKHYEKSIKKDESQNFLKPKTTSEVAPEKVITEEIYWNEVAFNEATTTDEVVCEDVPIQNNLEQFRDVGLQVFQKNENSSNFGGQKDDDEKDEVIRQQIQNIDIFKAHQTRYEERIDEWKQEIRENQRTIAEQQNVINEREQIIEERDRMIEERDRMLRQREQKIKIYEDKTKTHEHNMDILMKELYKSYNSLVAALHDKKKYCLENHRGKPGPKRRNTVPEIEIFRPFLLFEDHILQLTGNSPLMLQTPPSTVHKTLCSSSPVFAPIWSNSANISNTIGNTTAISISNGSSSSIINSVGTADLNSTSNNCQTIRQQQPQQNSIQALGLDWTVDVVPQAFQSQMASSQYPTQSTTSAAAQSNSSGGISSFFDNVPLTSHQMIPRQPERLKSVQKVSIRRKRLKTYASESQHKFDLNARHSQQIKILQQGRVSQHPRKYKLLKIYFFVY